VLSNYFERIESIEPQCKNQSMSPCQGNAERKRKRMASIPGRNSGEHREALSAIILLK